MTTAPACPYVQQQLSDARRLVRFLENEASPEPVIDYTRARTARAAANFKRPLLSVGVSLCLCVGNFDTKYLGN